VVVSKRFNGPLDSGNGGYSAGVFASRLDPGPVEVDLRSPIPLDEPIEPQPGDGGAVRFISGETLVAEARPAPGFSLATPDPVSIEEAREAATRYPAPAEGLFSRCFVCGRAREDSFGVFAGPVADGSLVASPWTPPEWTADGDGRVRPEFAWAALDCPTYFAAFAGAELPLAFMAKVTATTPGQALAGEEHVVIAWSISGEGRKHRAGSAIFAPDGARLAFAEVLLIEPR
jgi:hypothetical protein